MRCSLITPTDESNLVPSQLADRLLVSDRIALSVTEGREVAEALSFVPLPVVEELIDTGTLEIAHTDGFHFVETMYWEDKEHKINRWPYKATGAPIGTVVPLLLEDKDFEEDFVQRSRPFLPRRIQDKILSACKRVRLDSELLLSVTEDDLGNQAIREAVRGKDACGLSKEQLLNQDFIELVKLIAPIFMVNSQLSLMAHNYELVGDAMDEAVMVAKFRSVFWRNSDDTQHQVYRRLCDLHDVPSVSDLVTSGAMTLADVLRVRNTPEGKAFRKWLSTQDAFDQAEILENYTRMLIADTRMPSLKRRLAVFAFDTTVNSLPSPFDKIVGIGQSAFQNLIRPLLGQSRPHLMFDHLNRFAKKQQRR